MIVRSLIIKHTVLYLLLFSFCVFLFQDKSTIVSVEVVRTYVNDLALQKEKVNILIPGADIKNVMGEGDDIIQTHVESGN